MKINNSILFLVIFGILLFSNCVRAEQSSIQWSIKGFGTFAAVGTDTDEIGFNRDISQTQSVTKSWGITPDSRLGLQFDAIFNEALQITIQWVARDHAGNFFEQNLEWAFLRWRPRNDLDIRVGRLGVDVYLLSDYRNVGYAYPWIRPPHEFYGEIPIYHFDGFDISKRYGLDTGYLTLKLFAGFTFNQVTTPPDNKVSDAQLAAAGGHIAYETDNWRTKMSYAYLHFLNDIPATKGLTTILNDPYLNFALPNISNVIPNLNTKDSDLHFISIGGSFDDGVWQAQAEASYLVSGTPLFPTQVSAYLSLGRHFSNVTLYTLFGIAQTFHENIDIPEPVSPDPELQQIHDTIDFSINQNGIDEKSISLGARWDIHSNFALKAQWSHFWLGKNGSQIWRKNGPVQGPDKVNVWSVGFDFIF